MAKQFNNLVATLMCDPLKEDDKPLLIVGMGDITYRKEPFKIVNSICGDEAIELWNKLTKLREDDQNGRTGNASN